MVWYDEKNIEKDLEVSSVNYLDLISYHDSLHVVWKKTLNGVSNIRDWTFLEIYTKHDEVVKELIKRKLPHISPIDSLDKIDTKINKENIEKIKNKEVKIEDLNIISVETLKERKNKNKIFDKKIGFNRLKNRKNS